MVVCSLSLLSLCVLGILVAPGTAAEEQDLEQLKGAWVAESLESGGKQAPPEAIKVMRFTFQEKELLIRGNFQDEREVASPFKIDATKNPKELEFMPPGEEQAVLGIYRFKEGKLEVCMRKANGAPNRPTSFETGDDGSLVLVKFKRETEEK